MKYISPENYWGRKYPDPIPPPELSLELNYETLPSEDNNQMEESRPSTGIHKLKRICKKYICDCRRPSSDEEHKMK